MKTLQAPSNKRPINPNYRRLYKTTATSCECQTNRFGAGRLCKHIKLTRFIQETNRMVMNSITGWRAVKNQEPAIKIRLNILKVLLSDALVMVASPFEIPSERREASARSAWLKTQIKQLEKRVAMIESRKAVKAPVAIAVAPVAPVENIPVVSTEPKQCEHKRTREEGYREKEVYCLDCKVLVRSYYPMST